MTLYTVLRKNETHRTVGEDEEESYFGPAGWQVWKEGIEARSSESAIREAIDGEVKEGTFVAVPSRSWEPKSVRVETRITLS